MSQKVTAIASVYDNVELVPHWLAHYSQLGVHQLILSVRSPEAFERIGPLATQYPDAMFHFTPADSFSDADKAKVESALLNDHCPDPDEYVMHLDLDEFQQYPAPLSRIVDLMNEAQDWALRGWIVDRIAAGGILKPIEPTPTLFEQFPYCCDLSGNVMGAWTQKIMLCRRRVRLRGGVRHDTENAYYDRVPVGTSAQYLVHHFKWIAGVAPRLQRRVNEPGTSQQYKHECRIFIEHCKLNGNNIRIDDPRIHARLDGAFQYPLGHAGGNSKRLISFSLWGDNPLYNIGAIENLKLASEIYPGWVCRFYCDRKAPAFSELCKRDCEVIPMSAANWSGLFWRFLAAAETGIECCILRDCDSRLNPREAMAVQEWLASGKALHTMHDHREHLSVPILGGMWGIRGGHLRDLPARMHSWMQPDRVLHRGPDQAFLQKELWPELASSHIGHAQADFLPLLKARYGVGSFQAFTETTCELAVPFVGAISPVEG